MSGQRRNDAGTTAVEFALVVMIILTIGFGAVDFGLWMFQKSEASQAAREGSRVAMIAVPSTLGLQTSGDVYNATIAELESNLPQLTVSVTCVDPTTDTDITVAAECSPGDLLTVSVQWHRDPLTFVGFTDTVSDSSTRTVVGVPS
jgi:Flp pilus assembly protein TadG